MSVWDAIVGQRQAVQRLRAVASSDASTIAQSWLICGGEGFGTVEVARAFAAALESPDHGEGETLSKAARDVFAGTHPDVHVLATNKVTISIDEVRDIIGIAEQKPSIAPWRIIIIEDMGRLLERTTNVLLKEIEEPTAHTIWILCAKDAANVLPTIRSRTQVVTLSMPLDEQIADMLQTSEGLAQSQAQKIARLSQGNVALAHLYAQDEYALAQREDVVANVLKLHNASQAVLLASSIITNANQQAQRSVEQEVKRQQEEFLRLNGLRPEDKIPPKLRSMYTSIGKKDEVKRLVTRRSRDVLDRCFCALASVYRDVLLLQASVEESHTIINQEQMVALRDLAEKLSSEAILQRFDEVTTARRRLAANGNPTLVVEALLCALMA